jgi:predicted Zn-dependent protease with MMP-like domain
MRIDDEQFTAWVGEAMELLPKRFRDALHNIAIDVESRPSAEVMRRMKCAGGTLLLGLYTGVPLTERTHQYGTFGAVPDKIVLYKESIEHVADTPREVRRQVARTLLHEVGHYFGMTEAQMHEVSLLDEAP